MLTKASAGWTNKSDMIVMKLPSSLRAHAIRFRGGSPTDAPRQAGYRKDGHPLNGHVD